VGDELGIRRTREAREGERDGGNTDCVNGHDWFSS
jgi:hypothetical protein